MHLTLYAIGKMKAGPEEELFSRYWLRAQKSGKALGLQLDDVRQWPESRAQNAEQRKDEEAARIIDALAQDTFLVGLDETGKDSNSAEFANLISKAMENGTGQLGFAIGGPDGHGQAIAKRADRLIRFGSLTWPHQLMRVMLAEQIYRAITILNGHPYHRR